MPVVRILLGNIGGNWKSMVEDIAKDNSDIQIVGHVENPVDVLLQARSENVDVVVLSQEIDGSEPGIASHFVLEYPNVAVVLVPANGGGNVLCRTALYRETHTASKEALRKMLRKFKSSED